MLNCNITVVNKSSAYMEQITSGFFLLQEQGKINCSFLENPKLKEEFYQDGIIELKLNNKRIIYELSDGYNNFPSFEAFDKCLDNVDFYFKACMRDDFHKNFRNRDKIYPLAPRYHVTYKKSWGNRIDFKKIITGNISEIKKYLLKLPFFAHSLKRYYIKTFEEYPKLTDMPKIFFYTRLWDPAIASAYSSQNVDLDGVDVEKRIKTKSEEYLAVSELRAGLVRALRKEFGNRFIGGVGVTEFSKKFCPDLITEIDMSSRKNYTHNLKSAEILVNTQGTHKCWNFSFGEGLAASRAIITEKPFYRVPDFLFEDKNFLTYSSIDECIEKVYYLFNNRDVLVDIMNNNRNYYLNHLRPDKYVWDTLEIILKDN